MTAILKTGQLGSTSVAAAALANQVAFTAQFWGKKDIASNRKVLGICMALCLLVAVLFTLIAEFLPSGVVQFFDEISPPPAPPPRWTFTPKIAR